MALRRSLVITLSTIATMTAWIGLAAAQCLAPPAEMTLWLPADVDGRDLIGQREASLHGGAEVGPGFVGGAFHLDGVDDFVSVPHAEEIDFGTSDFTVDLWVRFETIAGEQVLIEKFVSVGGFDDIGWTLTKIGSQLYLALGTTLGVGAATLIVPDVWTHVAARRQGTRFDVFVDGETAGSGVADIDLANDSALRLGHRGAPSDTPGSNDTRGFYLDGEIDEVEVFAGRALSDGEIRDLFAAGRAGKCKGAQRPEVPAMSAFGAAFAALALALLMAHRARILG